MLMMMLMLLLLLLLLLLILMLLLLQLLMLLMLLLLQLPLIRQAVASNVCQLNLNQKIIFKRMNTAHSARFFKVGTRYRMNRQRDLVYVNNIRYLDDEFNRKGYPKPSWSFANNEKHVPDNQ
jgi:hypothetical protein